jgi:hypothetical protein
MLADLDDDPVDRVGVDPKHSGGFPHPIAFGGVGHRGSDGPKIRVQTEHGGVAGRSERLATAVATVLGSVTVLAVLTDEPDVPLTFLARIVTVRVSAVLCLLGNHAGFTSTGYLRITRIKIILAEKQRGLYSKFTIEFE